MLYLKCIFSGGFFKTVKMKLEKQEERLQGKTYETIKELTIHTALTESFGPVITVIYPVSYYTIFDLVHIWEF